LGDRSVDHPGSTGSSTCAFEMQEVAVTQIA
jgi:hypothetical protein